MFVTFDGHCRPPYASGSDALGRMRMFLFTSASGGLPQNETTFAEIACAAGYKTGWSIFCSSLCEKGCGIWKLVSTPSRSIFCCPHVIFLDGEDDFKLLK